MGTEKDLEELAHFDEMIKTIYDTEEKRSESDFEDAQSSFGNLSEIVEELKVRIKVTFNVFQFH